MVLAAVLHQSPGELQLEEVVLDSPAPREVRVAVAATGLCHSDLRYLKSARPIPLPVLLGHEASGVVLETGSAVSYVRPGDHVVLFATGFCGTCEWCLSGHPTLCAQDQLQRPRSEPPRLRLPDGRPVHQYAGLGTFAEQVLVHENSLVKIDQGTPFDIAALVGCAVATGVGAVTRAARVSAGATVAVIGCGGVGLNVIQGAVLAGARAIIAIDISDGKLELARRFGATHVINSGVEDPLAAIERVLPGAGGVDYAFEAIGTAATCELAVTLLRPAGVATLIGVYDGSFPVSARALLHERKVQGSTMGSVRFRQDLPSLLDLYRAGRLELDALVSRRIPLEAINKGYAAITDGSVARSVVVFDGAAGQHAPLERP